MWGLALMVSCQLLIIYIFVFLFGLVVGSFLNSVICRLHSDKSFLFGRSICPHCQHKLSFSDLIPIFSFIFLKGKCRYCKKPISWQYPLVELATAILFVLIFWHWSLGLASDFGLRISDFTNIFFMLCVSCFLLIIFVYDLKHYIIPDKILYPAIAISFLYRILELLKFENWNLFRISDFGIRILFIFIPVFIISGFFLILYLLSQGRWLGFGDVKLGILLGLVLGWPKILVALFLAYLIGGIIGVGLVISKKKKLKSEVPFAPILITATFITLFFGNQIIHWYLNLIQ
jgi:prepilin signal peptidase PulO-like enzyme (type II secretory pathway)